MSKHTPGPWSPEGTRATGFMSVVAPESDFHEGHLVCSVNQGWGDQKGAYGRLPRGQTDANARLIAAAPDLLAACEAAVRFGAGHCSLDFMLDAARAAVARANGEDA